MALAGASSRTSDDLAGLFPDLISAAAAPVSKTRFQALRPLFFGALPNLKFR